MADGEDMQWEVHPVSRFSEFVTVWDALNHASGAVPFLYSAFIRQALAHFGRGDERLALLGSTSEPLAMAILVPRGIGVWQTFQPSQVPLGAWLMRRGLEYGTVGRPLLSALPGWGQLLAITQQDPAVHRRPLGGPVVKTLDYINTGWISLEGAFEDYWAARGKGLRQNMRTQRSRLSREGTAPQLDIVLAADQVEGVVESYSRLESSGWKGRDGTAVRIETAQGRFYAGVLRDYSAAGLGRLCVYRVGDRPVAIDLHIEGGETLVLLKTAYDEGLHGLSPSSLLREEMLKVLFEEGKIKRFEFFGPAMEWTYRWTDRVRTLFHVNVYRAPAARALHEAVQMVRSKATATQGAGLS